MIVVVVVVFVTLFPVVDLKKVLACFHLWLIDCGGQGRSKAVAREAIA